eukprot:6181243-Pleurochrysis_carterae.AAC.4
MLSFCSFVSVLALRRSVGRAERRMQRRARPAALLVMLQAAAGGRMAVRHLRRGKLLRARSDAQARRASLLCRRFTRVRRTGHFT